MGMTWDEFKAFVEAKLVEAGRDGTIAIWYIDVTYPHKESIHIEIEKDGTLTLW